MHWLNIKTFKRCCKYIRKMSQPSLQRQYQPPQIQLWRGVGRKMSRRGIWRVPVGYFSTPQINSLVGKLTQIQIDLGVVIFQKQWQSYCNPTVFTPKSITSTRTLTFFQSQMHFWHQQYYRTGPVLSHHKMSTCADSLVHIMQVVSQIECLYLRICVFACKIKHIVQKHSVGSMPHQQF